MQYEVLVWTEFNKNSPEVYKPLKEVHGDVNTQEKAIEFAEHLIKVLSEFKPYKYEVIERKIIVVKNIV